MSPARKRGKSLDVHVEQLAKGNRLGVAQLGEVPRYVLDWAVTLAQLNGQRATSNVSDCRGVPVLRKRIGKRLSTDSRVRSRVTHNGRVTALDLARARSCERLDGLLTPDLPQVSQCLGSQVGVSVGEVDVCPLGGDVVTRGAPVRPRTLAIAEAVTGPFSTMRSSTC